MLSNIIQQKDKVTTVGLIILMILVGIVLTWKIYPIYQEIKDKNIPNKQIILVILIMSIFLIILPIILLIINISGNYKVLDPIQSFETKLNVPILIFLYSIILLILMIFIANQENQEIVFDFTVWLTIVILIIGTAIFAYIRTTNDKAKKKSIFQSIGSSLSTVGSNLGSGLSTVGSNLGSVLYTGTALLGSKVGQYLSDTSENLYDRYLAPSFNEYVYENYPLSNLTI